jgi:hypothetical protein
MKDAFLILFFVIPFSLSAQLDKIYPKMTEEEFHKKIPEAVQLVSSSIFIDDSVSSVWVRKKYDLMNDTVVALSFFSRQVNGPCCGIKNPDQDGYSNLLLAAKNLFKHYTDVFGKAIIFKIDSLPPLSSTINEVNVFYANWKSDQGNITLRVFLDDTLITSGENWVSVAKRGKKDCPCKLKLDATGNGPEFKKEFGLGMSTLELYKFLSYPQATIDYMPKTRINTFGMVDSIGGNWIFSFYNDSLKNFSYNFQNFHSTLKDYPVLIEKTALLGTQAEKQFGKAKDSSIPPNLKHEKAKPFWKLFYWRDDYWSYWEMNKSTLKIELNEGGSKLKRNKIFMLKLTYSSPY